MSSNKNNRKDKGKGIRRAEDYQQIIPTKLLLQNQFQPLNNFPPLPYKAAVTKPPSKPMTDNA